MSSSWTTEIEAAVPAPRLFKAAILDWHTLQDPKVGSGKIVSASPVEGDIGGVGSIRQFNFASGTDLHIYRNLGHIYMLSLNERLFKLFFTC